LTKVFTTGLARLRKKKTTSENVKRLLLATEAVVFWGKMAYDIVKTTGAAPLVVADVTASLLLKAAEIRSFNEEEKLKLAMDKYWAAAQDFQRCCPGVIDEINREVQLLQL